MGASVKKSGSASGHADAGDRIRQSHAQILAAWERAVRRHLPAASGEARWALHNRLPDFLEEIARQLDRRSPSGSSCSELDESARDHGEERADLERYTLPQVFSEYVMLRQVLVEFLKATGPLEIWEVEVILDCIQRAMALAASRFAEARTVRERSFIERLETEAILREGFVAALSHDLRNPLSAARSCAEVASRMVEPSTPAAPMIHQVIASLDRVDRMIADLLDAYRVRAGTQVPIELERGDFRGVVQEAIQEIALVHGDRFVLRGPSRLDGIFCRNGVRRALENLLTNAVKYGDPAASIEVTISLHADRVRLSVHNWGHPIPPENQAMLFRPFQQSKLSDQGRNRGWGLGLTIAQGIAEAHGGRVVMESSPEKGTTFTIELPLDASSRVRDREAALRKSAS